MTRAAVRSLSLHGLAIAAALLALAILAAIGAARLAIAPPRDLPTMGLVVSVAVSFGVLVLVRRL